MKELKKIFDGDAVINSLEITHNGLKGGDAGSGGFVRIQIYSSSEIICDQINENSIHINVAGDAERRVLARCFLEIANELINNEYV